MILIQTTTRVLFLLSLLLLFNSIYVFSHKSTPRLTPFYNHPYNILSKSTISEDLKTYFYTQTLDHFNYAPQSYATFQQRYVVDYKHWGGAKSNSPIFAYLGAEAPLDGDLQVIGFLRDHSPSFKALSVYIEHRFYGRSIPYGSMDKAMNDSTTRGYFNSAQALADYAQVLLHVKKKLSAHKSPIIVIGGSYGGMLASWFRLKYPHIALGALASSSPILYFDNITPQNGYYSIVTKDFKEVSENCYQTIKESWSIIDKVASKPKGLSILSRRFKTCKELSSSSELKNFLETMYSVAAQYNRPPNYPVTMVCKGIDKAQKDSDILGRILGGIVSYRGNTTCIDTNAYNNPSETSVGWQWQTCSEIVMPIGRGENETMFPAAPFNLTQYINGCKGYFGISPRPHWITTYYGGHDIKLVLGEFGSNIIFSNGLKDPYSSGGVLEDISKSLVAVSTINGSHCLDILSKREDDPKWLVAQRNLEVKIIQGWINKSYANINIGNII